MRPVLPVLLLSLTLATTAWAQDSAPVATSPAEAVSAASDTDADPIGDILGTLPPDQTTDDDSDTRATAAEPVTKALVPAPVTPTIQGAPFAAPPAMVIAPTPIAPPRPAPRRPSIDRPVMIGEVGVTPDSPPTTADLVYENRIRSSVSNAQGLQGPLDGGWTVRGPGGAPLYSLQLVDRGGYGALEGAWRALGSAAGKLGLIDSLDRQPSTLTVRITRSYGKPTTVITLAPTANGWVGEMTDEAGSRNVTMQRN